MAGQFLLLMVFLDKFWFSPVGKVLDERDATIRNKLAAVKGNTGDVDKFAVEAQEILKVCFREGRARGGGHSGWCWVLGWVQQWRAYVWCGNSCSTGC
jgi:hypothetical protein